MRTVSVPIFILTLILAQGAPAGEEANGFLFADPEVFRIEKIGSDALATNIYSMTLDPRGRIHVSGPGYIRRLEDTDSDGILDRAVDFCKGPARGCQGMVFHGTALYTTGGRGLERYDDADGNGIADGPPKLLLPLSTGGEHGSHALRVGPDGSLYFLGGNYCGLPHSRVKGFSPVKHYYAGIFCRMDLEANSIEVWSEGMRNAYDFDFAPSGAVYGWDSDGERDEGMSWYRSCRIYHFTPGSDCGWRSIGSGKVPTYALDSVRPTAEVHRGSPTGVEAYDHELFDASYRGGIFALDWTLGRIYLFRPVAAGASYRAEPETFLRTNGRVSFAPSDIETAPDGSLLVSSGGRGVAGSIYRISLRKKSGTKKKPAPSALLRVLDAPEPLSAWSRANWVGEARKLSATPFLEFLGCLAPGSAQCGSARRCLRALEICLELFDSAAHATRLAATCSHASVRAQAARWLGIHGKPAQLAALLKDSSALVRRNAVESAARFWSDPAAEPLIETVFRLASTTDRRLRHAIISSLAHLDPEHLPKAKTAGEKIVRGWVLARATARGKLPGESLALGLALLAEKTTGTEDRLDALRLINAAFDRLEAGEDPRYATFDTQWDRVDLSGRGDAVERTLDAIEPLAATGDHRLAIEARRLAGKLGSSSPGLAALMAADTSASSPAADDLFLLWCLARLKGEWSAETIRKAAGIGLDLPAKIRSQGVGRDNKWNTYARAIWERLLRRHRKLGAAIVADPRFGDPEHLGMIAGAAKETRVKAAAILLKKPLPKDTPSIGKVLDYLNSQSNKKDRDAVRDLLRKLAGRRDLRGRALDGLSRAPAPNDRELFLDALSGDDLLLVSTALKGLDRLENPSEPSAEAFELVRWIHLADSDPTHLGLRDKLARRLEKLTDSDCGYRAGVKKSQGAALDCWREWIEMALPERKSELVELLSGQLAGEKLVEKLLSTVPWKSGDAGRGKKVFEARSCGSCHHLDGGGQRVGPDLLGAARRLGRKALLTEIILPDKLVAKRYYLTEYILKEGEVVQGRQVYSARNALVTITRQGLYRRLDPSAIIESRTRALSLMPAGLISGLEPLSIADLVVYLEKF
jgi:putative heme-binding domain-containing protein